MEVTVRYESYADETINFFSYVDDYMALSLDTETGLDHFSLAITDKAKCRQKIFKTPWNYHIQNNRQGCELGGRNLGYWSLNVGEYLWL